jgi:hypothetical protein
LVSSPYGSTASSVAILTLIAPPVIQATLVAANTLVIQLDGSPSQTYILQYASSLAAPINWQPIFTNTANTNGSWAYTNNIVPTNGSAFYRAVQL